MALLPILLTFSAIESMILGTGIDLASLQRLERGAERFGERFLARVLSAEERERLPSGKARARFLAGRWAAKEALAKALGTGFAEGVAPDQISVLNLPSGMPAMTLKGAALARFQAMGGRKIHLSITHDGGRAAALVVLED